MTSLCRSKESEIVTPLAVADIEDCQGTAVADLRIARVLILGIASVRL